MHSVQCVSIVFENPSRSSVIDACMMFLTSTVNGTPFNSHLRQRRCLLFIARYCGAIARVHLSERAGIHAVAAAFGSRRSVHRVHVRHASFSVDGLIGAIHLGNCRTLVI